MCPFVKAWHLIKRAPLVLLFLICAVPAGAQQNFLIYPLPTANSAPQAITPGPDGAMWFSEQNSNQIGRIDNTGAITEYPVPTPGGKPLGITSGSDGALWFAENGASKIGRITTSGIVSEFPIGALTPFWIVTGSDGNLWFTTTFKQITLGKLTVSGAETSYGGPVSSDLCGLAAGSDGALWGSYRGGATALRVDTAGNITNPAPGALGLLCGDIASGPDGALWITAPDGSGRRGAILRLATSGAVTSFPVDRSTTPYGITAGQDGALWFTDLQASIGRITTAGQVTKFALPKGTLPATRIATAPDGALWFTGYCVQGNVCQNQGNFTPPNYIGRFGTTFTLTVSSNGGNGTVTSTDGAIACGAGCIANYAANAPVTLTAKPAPGWNFAGWGDACNGTASCTVTMAGARNVTADFALNTYTLSIGVGGSGAVTSSPAGISNCTGRCNAAYSSFTQVNLSATPSAGSVFLGWGGGCSGAATVCTVAMDGPTSVTANFQEVDYPLTASVAGSGSIASSPAGIDCGASCNASFATGTLVALTATPAPDNGFVGWGGSCTGSGATCVLPTSGPANVFANFAQIPAGGSPLVASVLPTSRSSSVAAAGPQADRAPAGTATTTASAFATVINSGSTAATSCGIVPVTTIPVVFHYQTTDPATNALTRTPDTPVDIPAGGMQTFLVAMTPTAGLPPLQVSFGFSCGNAGVAPRILGVSTLLYSVSTAAVPDIVALGTTTTKDGVLAIPGVGSAGAFAVATVNVGASGIITVGASADLADLPLSLSLCQTDPVSGQCRAAPTPTVTAAINANDTPTFAVFADANGTVPFDPATNRVFVQFVDTGGAVRGSTSVAVKAQ